MAPKEHPPEKQKLEEICGAQIPWLEYLQLAHLFRYSLQPAGTTASMTDFEKLIKLDTLPKTGLISVIYKFLLGLHRQPPYAFQWAWKKDLHRQITENEWAVSRGSAVFHSRSTNIQTAAYKVYYRWHLTLYKLHRIHPSELCWKGCGDQGTYVHCFWGCPRLQSFWTQVLHYIEIITECNTLLNIWETAKPSPITLNLIVLLLSAAKSLIASHWKTIRIP